MLMFWEIVKMAYYGKIEVDARFSSDAGIIYFGYDKMFYWEDTDEVVLVAMMI